jgi:hypothetical protein
LGEEYRSLKDKPRNYLINYYV